MDDPRQIEIAARNLIRDGQLQQAAVLCDQLNRDHPAYEAGWHTASQLAVLIREPEIGVKAIDRALALSPGKPEWLLQRIECMSAMGDATGSMALARQLLPHRFEDALMSSQFGHVLRKLGMFDEALPYFERACELQPDDGRHYYNIAAVYRLIGEFDKATAALNVCVQLKPDSADALMMRAGLRTQTVESNNVAELESAYARSKEHPRNHVRICYALAKELDDLGEFDCAFAYLTEGSDMRRQQMQYDQAEDLETMAVIQSAFGREQLQRDTDGHVNAEPIFVIGMPRTGITLVERVLTRHSVVGPAGDVAPFSVELLKLCGQVEGPAAGSAAELASFAQTVDFEVLGKNYITSTRANTGEKAHFVDSLPANFLSAGMIHLALPKAKIVLLQRDPMDTCYAVFKTLFERGYPFSYDLLELANYYVAYRRLTDHWLQLMPDVVHVVRYEDLLDHPRDVIENLLDYCNLSFEEDCVAFYDEKTLPTSRSTLQIRRAFTRATTGHWRNYEKQLQPVVDILAQAGLHGR